MTYSSLFVPSCKFSKCSTWSFPFLCIKKYNFVSVLQHRRVAYSVIRSIICLVTADQLHRWLRHSYFLLYVLHVLLSFFIQFCRITCFCALMALNRFLISRSWNLNSNIYLMSAKKQHLTCVKTTCYAVYGCQPKIWTPCQPDYHHMWSDRSDIFFHDTFTMCIDIFFQVLMRLGFVKWLLGFLFKKASCSERN